MNSDDQPAGPDGMPHKEPHGEPQLLLEVASLREELASVATANARAALEMAELYEERQREWTEQRTALHAALVEAQSASQRKDEFLANISHELRTPLNGIIGMNTLLLESLEAPLQRDFAETALESAAALLELINDLLDMSKIEASAVDIEREPFDFWHTLDGVVRLLAPRRSAERLDFGALVGPGVQRTLIGDGAKVRQVLLNLCGNALKFTDQGRVIARAYIERGELVVDVEDTGCGIPAESIHDIFQSFRQCDNSATRRHGGTGLGLAISRNLAELMGGSLTVKSEVGRGSTFQLRLPVVDGPTSVAPSPAECQRVLAFLPSGIDAEVIEGAAQRAKVPFLRSEPGSASANGVGPGDCVFVHAPEGKTSVATQDIAAALSVGAKVAVVTPPKHADEWRSALRMRVLASPLGIVDTHELLLQAD